MSFIYASFDNQTPYLHSEADYDTDSIVDGYLKYKYQDDNLNTKKIYNYKKNKNTITDDILNYNYQKFTNGQLTLAIISLIMFNYDIISS
tara:strand:+ start:127 stop:396 length:270 start_codon:yes stop_codon:yes gene_type:complete